MGAEQLEILPVPPLEEQNQIARHLEEQRRALITAAVTGQIA